MKVANCVPLTNEYSIAAAHSLLSMFRVTNPLDILQSVNIGGFLSIARSGKTMHFTLEEMSIIIICYYQIWLGIK